MATKRFATDKSGAAQPNFGSGKRPVRGFSYGSQSRGLAKRAAIFFLIIAAMLLLLFSFGYYFGTTATRPSQAQFAAITLPTAAPASAGAARQAEINILAVTSDGNGSTDTATVQVIPGDGKILFSINPFIEPDTQDSVQTAALVAQQYTDTNLGKNDVIYSINDSPADLVGGPSAGAAMTVATIAAIEGKNVRSDAAITGTIADDGSIGPVGGVLEKAVAAAQAGFKLMVVPAGQSTVSYYAAAPRQITARGGFRITRTAYTQQTVDLQSYLKQQGYSMQVVEAASIEDAAKLMIA